MQLIRSSVPSCHLSSNNQLKIPIQIQNVDVGQNRDNILELKARLNSEYLRSQKYFDTDHAVTKTKHWNFR